MSVLDIRVDTSGPRAFLQAKLESMRAVQPLAFDLYNIARDESAIVAGRPNQAIFYYEAINTGRVGFEVHIGARGPNRSPMLHFKVSASEWRVVRSVGPVSPRRITVEAIATLQQSLTRVAASAMARLSPSGVPDGPALLAALAAMEAETLRVFEAETESKTILHDTKQQFYNVPSTPLSRAFRTVPAGNPPPTA